MARPPQDPPPARLIQAAVETVLANPAHRTVNRGGTLGTTDIANLVCQSLP